MVALVQAGLCGDDPVAVFDIGGTWFRAGIYRGPASLSDTFREPAVNFRNCPAASPSQLQEKLVAFLVRTVARYRREVEPKIKIAGVSLGAALNALTGEVYDSGPLWGPECEPFNLLSSLATADPDTHWMLTNDVTAGLAGCSLKVLRPDVRKAILITVSTGIGCRILDLGTGRVPVDRVHGLQGEIGHLPVAVSFGGIPLNRVCDCGGAGHLNAYASGRGIEGMLLDVAVRYPDRWSASILGSLKSLSPGANLAPALSACLMDRFATAIVENDSLAQDVLSTAVRPLAEILRVALTLDPEIDRIILTGGVVHSLGEAYVEALASSFETTGLYLITDRDPGYLRRRLCFAPVDDTLGLLGMGVITSGRWAFTNPASSI